MNWDQLDWPALERLRTGFLTGSAAAGPYWQSPADLASYDLTYAERIGWKWDALLRELTLRRWNPPAGSTLIDWGCGSGVAGRRVAAAFGAAHFAALHVWDHSEHARTFAAIRARETFPDLAISALSAAPSAEPATLNAQRLTLNSKLPVPSSQLSALSPPPSPPPAYTLVLSHVLNELSADQRAQLLALIAGAEAVLWVEPGTHADSRALATLRDQLRDRPYRIVAPCTHRETCPLFQAAHERDWCHFFAPPPAGIQNDSQWVRFSHRTGLDLRSQAYSCLVLDKPTAPDATPATPPPARVLGRAEVFKPYARFLACEATGLHLLELSKRTDPALIKRLDRNPPVPLYALEHQGRQVITMTPLVAEAQP